MKKFFLILLFLLMCISLNGQDIVKKIKTDLPYTYNTIRIRSVHIWVSEYDLQMKEIYEQCVSLEEYLKLESQYSFVPHDLFNKIREKALNRWAEKHWKDCQEQNVELDVLLSCMNANWTRVVDDMKRQLKQYIPYPENI